MGAPVNPPALLRTRILETIRGHLVDCQVDPDLVVEDAEFGVDLEVDSLDLQTLAQTLEDTYGVRIDDEQASELITVRATIDFVLAGIP